MRVLILGIDGYIGWALANNLLNDGYEVAGIDNYSRRTLVKRVGSDSLIPISGTADRIDYLYKHSNFISASIYNITLGHSAQSLRSYLFEIRPDVIIHLAEQPSAPYSMISPNEAKQTQVSNISSTIDLLWAMREECPDAHLVKLGTMGEYGTPNCDIPEGFISPTCIENDRYFCPLGGLFFPRQPGSFYHLSKVFDSMNIEFACKTWGLTSTDIMQGIVFGNEYNTRFDYDQYFGTVINRFCVQALIGLPLTVYGIGEQVRGFLPLKDSIQCIKLIINNPPSRGEYRVINQFENIYIISQVAEIVQASAMEAGLRVRINHINNPRFEKEIHYYNPKHKILLDMGYAPTTDINEEVYNLIKKLIPYSDDVREEVIMPTTSWR